MINVLVLDKNFKPQNPIHPGMARILLKEHRAKVYKFQPFSIILKVTSKQEVTKLQLKIDPGSVTTGLAVINNTSGQVVWVAELTHHGKLIKTKLDKRRAFRRSRRSRKTRYRKPRFLNRVRSKNWLPPSLLHRVYNIQTWVNKLISLIPIDGISLELVKFDTQKLDNPNISGIEYQRGTLQGYEIKEYLLEKFNRTCVYCDSKNVPLQIDHVIPKSKSGSNRISNLVLSCSNCNQDKGSLSIEEFLKHKPTLLKKIKLQLKKPLKDIASVNSTKNELLRRLINTGLPVECGSGALTKYNRTIQNLPKTHWLDATCIGSNTPKLIIGNITPLYIKSYSHGSRQTYKVDSYGFPKIFIPKEKTKYGFRTGDLGIAIIPKGKNKGRHIGRIVTRTKPSFAIGNIDGVHPKHITILQRNDGYGYKY